MTLEVKNSQSAYEEAKSLFDGGQIGRAIDLVFKSYPGVSGRRMVLEFRDRYFYRTGRHWGLK